MVRGRSWLQQPQPVVDRRSLSCYAQVVVQRQDCLRRQRMLAVTDGAVAERSSPWRRVRPELPGHGPPQACSYYFCKRSQIGSLLVAECAGVTRPPQIEPSPAPVLVGKDRGKYVPNAIALHHTVPHRAAGQLPFCCLQQGYGRRRRAHQHRPSRRPGEVLEADEPRQLLRAGNPGLRGHCHRRTGITERPNISIKGHRPGHLCQHRPAEGLVVQSGVDNKMPNTLLAPTLSPAPGHVPSMLPSASQPAHRCPPRFLGYRLPTGPSSFGNISSHHTQPRVAGRVRRDRNVHPANRTQHYRFQHLEVGL
ncbi:hypothetical protein QF050_003410 [Arthrobacter sp. SLBN-112]|nr:hypothetical protein [Arthrobacter sp. SLBN-112]